MGPNARSVLTAVTDTDLGNAAFPWLSAREIATAAGNARALRVSYVGEFGWELHVSMDRLRTLYDALFTAGKPHDLRPFGAYAMNSMRLEKGYRAWGMDLTSERTPLEAGLGHLVRSEGRDFIGRDAILAREGRADAWRMGLLEVSGDGPFDPFYVHTVYAAERPVGIVTSGAFGHRTGKALALAYFTPEWRDGEALSVDIIGQRRAASVLETPPYDPANRLVRDVTSAEEAMVHDG